jgi:hypothetical protein
LLTDPLHPDYLHQARNRKRKWARETREKTRKG